MFRYTPLILAFLAVTPALAGPREDVYSASQRCVALADDRSWLECYYGAAQPMRGQLQLPAAPASQTALIPPPLPVSAVRQQAPAPQKPGPVGRTIDFLMGGDALVSGASIKSFDAGKQGGFTVTLANGQVWKQADEQTRFVRWRDGPGAHKVTIWKGALNTFSLGFDEEADKYKVRRLK